MKLIDTDILIDFSHEIEAAEQFLETLRNSGETLAISAITRMELVEGCRNKRELTETIEFLGEFKLIHLSEQISQKAIELIESYKLSHGLLIPDAIIAATAIWKKPTINLYFLRGEIECLKKSGGFIETESLNCSKMLKLQRELKQQLLSPK